MSVAIVTGAGGLIGSEAVAFLIDKGLDVVGIDNDMRAYFFGEDASTRWRIGELTSKYRKFNHASIDIRDFDALSTVFETYGSDITIVVHAAAQPSHDWAASEPFTDFSVNANGTLNMLEATRRFASDASFIFTSTNKVYGDTPNKLPLVELDTRWELASEHPYFSLGIDETMSVDQSTHSLFGASKLAADMLVQEYGRYFGLNTSCFRGGCLTGGGHSGTELHGFLAYLMKCVVTERPYTIFGYKGKQVRDNIHASDLVAALWRYCQDPVPGRVYNIGGSRFANCSMQEAIAMCERISGRTLQVKYSGDNRVGDHIWWVSDISRFQSDFPDFELKYDIEMTLQDIHESGAKRWLADA